MNDTITTKNIYLYNSLTKQIEPLKPIQHNKIGMYMCGITAYDLCHLGHARSQIVSDVMNRIISYAGYRVTLVRNITDIDDKIINRAKEMQLTPETLTLQMINHMHDDFMQLNILQPTHEPKATEYIKDISIMITRLLEGGYAYHKGDDIYFDVSKYADYGILSRQRREKLLETNREIIGTQLKEHKEDFILWKSTPKEALHFESSLGPGRPGWHIECSAMSSALLGSCFDVHIGGADLMFPHHENEIAQSHCANESFPAHYWVHIGLLTVGNKKMSKSLHNHILIKDVLKKYDGNALRLMVLNKNYRKPIEFSFSLLDESKASLTKVMYNIRDISIENNHTSSTIDKALIDTFTSYLYLDFNTPKAIRFLFSLNKKSKTLPISDRRILCNTIKFMLEILGFTLNVHQNSNYLTDSAIQELIHERSLAKLQHNYVRADEIRSYLLKFDILLIDTAAGTSWKRR